MSIITEKCGCGSSIVTPVMDYANRAGWDLATGLLKDWRENHRCSGNSDTPQASEYDDMPTIVESSSSHERAMPFGFAPEPEGGW